MSRKADWNKFVENEMVINHKFEDIYGLSIDCALEKRDVPINVLNKSEYVEWQQRLIISEKRKSFYLRILESWKANSQQIIQLAQNARTEIFSLKTQDKANEDITKEKLIRHVKDEDYSNDELKVSSVTPTVKKIKKVVN